MAFEQKDNSGALFRNERKEQENHPDHTGTCKIMGREFYLSAWVRESNNGKRFFSLSFKPKDNASADAKRKPQPKADEDFDDSIPFAWIITGLFSSLLSIAAYSGFSIFA